jgi:hypothetical protein
LVASACPASTAARAAVPASANASAEVRSKAPDRSSGSAPGVNFSPGPPCLPV